MRAHPALLHQPSVSKNSLKKSRSQIQDSEPGERAARQAGAGGDEFLRSCCPIRSDFFFPSPQNRPVLQSPRKFLHTQLQEQWRYSSASRKGVASCSGGTKPAPPYTRRPVPGGPPPGRDSPGSRPDHRSRSSGGGLCGGGGGGERRTRPRCDRIGFGWPGHSARPRGARVAFSFRWPLPLGAGGAVRSGQLLLVGHRCRSTSTSSTVFGPTRRRARKTSRSARCLLRTFLPAPRGLCVAGSSRELVLVASLSFSSESRKGDGDGCFGRQMHMTWWLSGLGKIIS